MSSLCAQALESVHVFLVVPGIVHWCFQDEGFRFQFGLIQNAAKAFQPDLSLTNVGVAVEMRCQRPFGVVRVNHLYVLEAEDRLDLSDRMFQAR